MRHYGNLRLAWDRSFALNARRSNETSQHRNLVPARLLLRSSRACNRSLKEAGPSKTSGALRNAFVGKSSDQAFKTIYQSGVSRGPSHPPARLVLVCEPNELAHSSKP